MRSSCVMFVAAICILLLVKLKWPKNKSVYDEKRHIIREKAMFPIVSKMAIFRTIAKEGPRKNLRKLPIFWANFGRRK